MPKITHRTWYCFTVSAVTTQENWKRIHYEIMKSSWSFISFTADSMKVFHHFRFYLHQITNCAVNYRVGGKNCQLLMVKLFSWGGGLEIGIFRNPCYSRLVLFFFMYLFNSFFPNPRPRLFLNFHFYQNAAKINLRWNETCLRIEFLVLKYCQSTSKEDCTTLVQSLLINFTPAIFYFLQTG